MRSREAETTGDQGADIYADTRHATMRVCGAVLGGLATLIGCLMPEAAREAGERAFVRVLRRRYPGALFIVHDVEGDRPVTPGDGQSVGEILGGPTSDDDGSEEAA